MRSLSDIVYDRYRWGRGSSGYYADRVMGHEAGINGYLKFPCNTETFEVPIAALRDIGQFFNYDLITMNLRFVGWKSTYASVDSIVRDVLYGTTENCLVKMSVPNSKIYYGACGLILDGETLNPVMMMSWIVRKCIFQTGLDYIKPVMRIDPCCFIDKEDAVQRYIINKLNTTVLNTELRTTPLGDIVAGIKPQVIIEKSPFKFKRVTEPTINTTSRELAQVALDYLDDIE